MPTTADFGRVLRGPALRVTRPRVAVLSAVHGEVPAALTAAGPVRRLQPTGSVARCEAGVRDSHHHAVCRSCGDIADVDCAVGYTACLTAAGDSGYEIDEAEVIYWGRCPACVAAASAASGD